jgi:hypothetical protein
LYVIKKFKLGKLTDGVDEFYNIASSAACKQIYMALVTFIFKNFYPCLYFDLFLYCRIPVNNGWRTGCDRHITFSENKIYSHYHYEIKQTFNEVFFWASSCRPV